MTERARTEVTRREVLLLAAGACLLAVVMNWPLILNLRTDIPRDIGDPLVQAWQMAWGGQALGHQPFDFFQANHFYPFDDTLAFSDALIGYAPAGLIGEGPLDAVARYNLLFMFSYALAFLGAYLLGRELGLTPLGASVAGAAYAWAPYKLEQDGHMQVISSGGVPLALALALRGYRLRQPVWVVSGFAVAAWQLSLGFTIGLPLAHLIGLLGMIAAVYWWRAGRPPLPRNLVVATGVGALIFAGTAAWMAPPYLRVADEHPQAHRSPETVDAFSGPAKVFLTAPAENSIWGGATSGFRDTIENVPEKTLFPGLVILVLAGIGLASGVFPKALRVGLGIGVLGVSILALGFNVDDGLVWPYRILFEINPLWEAIRVPGRLLVFSSLGLALLAGAGSEGIRRRLFERSKGGRTAVAIAGTTSLAGGALAAVLVLMILTEGRGLPFDPFDDQEQPAVPVSDARFAHIGEPQLHIPADRAEDNRRYLLWSTDGFPKMVNGRSSLVPFETADLIESMHDFPNPDTVERLRALGVQRVVLHTGRVKGTAWEDAGERPIDGLSLTRKRRGYVLVYALDSPKAGEVESVSGT